MAPLDEAEMEVVLAFEGLQVAAEAVAAVMGYRESRANTDGRRT